MNDSQAPSNQSDERGHLYPRFLMGAALVAIVFSGLLLSGAARPKYELALQDLPVLVNAAHRVAGKRVDGDITDLVARDLLKPNDESEPMSLVNPWMGAVSVSAHTVGREQQSRNIVVRYDDVPGQDCARMLHALSITDPKRVEIRVGSHIVDRSDAMEMLDACFVQDASGSRRSFSVVFHEPAVAPHQD